MKNRRLLAALLSVAMVVSSWSLCVMAAGDEEQPDQAIALNESDPVNTTLGELQEGVIFRQDGLEGTQTIAFTPETTAKYSLLVSNTQEFTVSVTDLYGTQVMPVKTQKTDVGSVFDLKLQAGKKYIFAVDALSYHYRGVFSLYICKTAEQLKPGPHDFLIDSNSSAKTVSFTPDQSGVYYFTTRGESFVSNTVYTSCYVNHDGQSLEQVNSSYSDGYVAIVYLTAGVTYDVKVGFGGASYNCFTLVHLNIFNDVPSLAGNQNQISFAPCVTTNWYSFTPSEDGVYVFSSQGQYRPEIYIYSSNGNSLDFAGPEGGSDDFTLVKLLKGGNTYYFSLTIPDAYAEEITFPVSIVKLPVYGTGDHYITAGLYETVYCPFAAENDGYYIFCTGTDAVGTYSYFDNSYVSDNSHAHYLEEGELMLLQSVNTGDAGSVPISIQPVTVELDTAEDTTLTKHTDGNAYATFTPDKNGMYRFSVSCESGFDRVCLFDKSKRGDLMAKKNESDDYKSFSCYLTAGETYVLDVRLYSSSSEQVKVSVKSESIPTVYEGENQIAIADPDRIFVFVPEESGLYQFSNNDSRDIKVYLDNKILGYSMYESDYNNYRIAAYEMTAGKEYTVEIDLDWFSGDKFFFNISRPAVITEAGSSIPKIGVKQYAFFTPSETKIYGIGCVDGSVNALYYKPADSNNFSYVSSDYSNGKRYSILEKDVTYLVLIEAGFGHTSKTYDLSIATERTLKTGTNKNVLIENLQGFGSHYTCYSFVPEKSGLYSFRSENNGGLTASAFLYKEFDTYEEIGHGYGSYLDGNMNMTAMLEAGVTYRLWMYTDQSDQDVTIDLIIEQLPAGTLAGYSLSLDGSIAVNLYMSLADYVVNSETAVLKYTRPDGKVVEYKIDAKNIKTVNNNDYYVFHLPVEAKEMTDTLAVQIIDEENGIESEQFVFTVQQYAETILRDAFDEYGYVLNQEYADAVPLVKALLNYGTQAQLYFNHRPRYLANDSLYMKDDDRALGSLNVASLPHYVKSDKTEQLPNGLTFEGSSLSVDSETTLTFYFINSTGKTLTFTNEAGEQLSSRRKDEYTLVKVTGIPAHKLDEDFRLNIRVSDDEKTYFATYSPLYYCYNVLNRATNETRTDALKNLMKAFYFYNQAAKDYIGEE
ncbi:MAG: hypothetical protein J6Y58_00660 [Clostridiales bacterium]|nr:hypothetical protein [Clostridiales bacterium]